MKNIKLRYLKKDEIEEAIKIVEINYSKEDALWAKKELIGIFQPDKDKIRYSDAIGAIGKLSGKILGFAVFNSSWISDVVAELFWVNVLPNYQHVGIGSLLIKEVIKRLKQINKSDRYKPTVLILCCKNSLIRFYNKFGFKTISRVSRYEVLMQVNL